MAILSAKLKTPAKNKDSRFFARISSEDKILIEKAASITGQSAAAFVIAQAREAAARFLENMETIRLNQAESRRLMAALKNPPSLDTKRMCNVARLYRETVISDVNPDLQKISPH